MKKTEKDESKEVKPTTTKKRAKKEITDLE